MTKPCGRPVLHAHGGPGGCPYPRAKGKQRCLWHILLSRPADVQATFADSRLALAEEAGRDYRARVPEREWPAGERWCAGCQSFVPLFYTTGSRCKACSSRAAHAGRIEKLYGIDEETYQRLFKLQRGRCAICGRRPQKKRLAVDHDHKTGAVRGLLCANNENGCNRAVIANLEASVDGGLAAAQRAVAYLERPPLERLVAGEPWERYALPQIHATSTATPQEAPF